MEIQQSDPSKIPEPILTLPGHSNITIRPYHASDAPSLSINGNSKAVWNNLRNRMPHPYLPSHALDWITHCNDPVNFIATGPFDPAGSQTVSATTTTGPRVPTHYAVVIAGSAAGSIGLALGDPGDVYARSAEVGYWLGESYWGKGVMRMVVPAFVEWSWGTFGVLVRLNAELDEGSGGSRRCLEKAGLRVEGRRARAIWKNGEFRDVMFMGMLRPGVPCEAGGEA